MTRENACLSGEQCAQVVDAAPVVTPMEAIDVYVPERPDTAEDSVVRNCDSIVVRPVSPKSVPALTMAGPL